MSTQSNFNSSPDHALDHILLATVLTPSPHPRSSRLIPYLFLVSSKTTTFPSGKTLSHLSLVAGFPPVDRHLRETSPSWTDIRPSDLTEFAGPWMIGLRLSGYTAKRKREEGLVNVRRRMIRVHCNGRMREEGLLNACWQCLAMEFPAPAIRIDRHEPSSSYYAIRER